MIYKGLFVGLLWVLFLMEGTAYAYQLAGKLESLVMPGPVSRAHEKYEEQCSKCHSPLN